MKNPNYMTSFKKSPLVESTYDELPKPKFLTGTIVKVQDEMPESMSHFESGFIGVVANEHDNQLYCDEYKLIVLDKNGMPVNSIAWYREDMLTLVSDDTEYGKKVIDVYNQTRV